MKRVEIIPIALRKMGRRGITEKMVIETVSRPEQVVMGYAGRPVVHRRYETGSRVKLLRVVYEEASDRRIVVTAYLTSDVERYWKEKGR